MFRLRALAIEVLGYDLEMENFDQSPYYRNASGSSNTKTIDLTGTNEVTLIEGHADTRDRWTFNAMTWSNVERILEEGPPYCECMFKGGEGTLDGRLKEYVRSCGHDKWMCNPDLPRRTISIFKAMVKVTHDIEVQLSGIQWSSRWTCSWDGGIRPCGTRYTRRHPSDVLLGRHHGQHTQKLCTDSRSALKRNYGHTTIMYSCRNVV